MREYSPFRRQSFAARRPARTPQQLRQDWIAAIMLAGSLGETAATFGDAPGERDAQFGQNLTRLTRTLRDIEPGNFPLQNESARCMAAAFLKLARDFCHPAWTPQARTACAAFLQAGAKCLDGLLDGLRLQEAQHGRRILGEKDED